MRRREFITLVGGAAAWPLAARAQPAMPMIGYLDPTSPGNFADPLRGFYQGLKEMGYVEGQNVAISYRFAENKVDRLPELADDLVRQGVTVIITFSTGVFAAKAATTTIPIVFVLADDPVRLGIVTNIARPGGNLTGVNFLNAELSAKRLDYTDSRGDRQRKSYPRNHRASAQSQARPLAGPEIFFETVNYAVSSAHFLLHLLTPAALWPNLIVSALLHCSRRNRQSSKGAAKSLVSAMR